MQSWPSLQHPHNLVINLATFSTFEDAYAIQANNTAYRAVFSRCLSIGTMRYTQEYSVAQIVLYINNSFFEFVIIPKYDTKILY